MNELVDDFAIGCVGSTAAVTTRLRERDLNRSHDLEPIPLKIFSQFTNSNMLPITRSTTVYYSGLGLLGAATEISPLGLAYASRPVYKYYRK